MIKKAFVFGLVLLAVPAVFALPVGAQDESECQDHPMFNRLSDFVIDSCEVVDFDSYTFMNKNEEDIVFEGKTTKIYYCLKEGGRKRAFLEIWRNYANALAKLGGTTEYTDNYNAYLHLLKGDAEMWVHLEDTGGECYNLIIVEKKAMAQEITANEMLEALNKDGFIALYINFDTGKADIKPESEATVAQIVSLLQENADLKVSIEGHTDNVGTPANNITLSKQRAEAVMSALVKLGIGAGRLAAVGWGQDKPIADNRSDAGKAKNRRVEIVKK